MDRRIFSKVTPLLWVMVGLCSGINSAEAGPGGGTYYANSPAGGVSGTALRKFVDSLPGVGPPGCTQSVPPGTGTCNENNLGQFIPVAQKFATPPAGVPNDADYYEIGVVQYRKQLHSDLPLTTGNAPNGGTAPGKGTLLRGYSDLNPALGATDAAGAAARANYLGPLIIATSYDPTKPPGVNGNGKPVRVKLRNLLPTGAAGDLFIPTDTTLMGAGLGPDGSIVTRRTAPHFTFMAATPPGSAMVLPTSGQLR